MDEFAYKAYKAYKRKKKRRRERILLLICCGAVLLISCVILGWLIHRHHRANGAVNARQMQLLTQPVPAGPREVTEMERPPLDVQLLTVSEYARPGFELEQVNGIVIHYTANPGTTAQENRNYFENLKDTQTTKASSHFIIGLDGEIVQCIPCNEWAYASNQRNEDTISIECCIPDESGAFTEETYDSLVELVSWLCFRYGLTEEDLLRHYDITGKNCPKNFVEQPGAWEDFCEAVRDYMEKQANES